MTISRYFGFTDFTPVIPQLYWNVYSNEQRMKAICKELCKLIQYADMLGLNITELQNILKDIQEGKFNEQIREAIERWFDENEPEIMNRLATLEEKTEALETFEKKTKKKLYSQPSFAVKSRVALDMSDARYADRGYQSGCVFVQNDRHYCVFWMATDDATMQDTLVIVDMDANEIRSTLNMQGGHGQCPTYNPNTKELSVCNYNEIFYINVADPSTPYIDRSYATPNIPGYGRPQVIAWDDSDYEHYYVFRLNQAHNDFVALKTTVDFELVEVINLDVWDEGRSSDYQSIDANDGLLYISLSKPECVVICDAKTGERVNVIDIPEFIGFLPIREIEWTNCYNGILYISQANYYPGYTVPVVFEWDMEKGTVTSQDFFKRMVSTYEINNSQIINVAWTSADLIKPFKQDNMRPTFKFIEDACEYAKHYDINAILKIAEDYPNFANITNWDFELHPISQIKIGGLSFYNCNVLVVNGSYLTFTGENSSVIHNATYAYAIRTRACRIVFNDQIWNCEPIDTSKTASNGYFVSSEIIGAPVKEWGIAVFFSCIVLNQPNSHANVINQQNTIWLNG